MTLRFVVLSTVCLAFAGVAHGRETNVSSEYRDYQNRTVISDSTTSHDLPGNVELELHSGMLDRKPDGPFPAFGELDRNGDGVIDESEAASYRLLGDDFIHADDNRDTRVSAREYAHWVRRN